MKTLNIKLIYILGIFVLTFLSSCENAQYDAITDSHVYMVTQNGSSEKRLSVEEEGAEVQIALRLNKAIKEDVNVNLEVNSAYLEVHNKRNGTSFQLLPPEFYTLEKKSVTIPASEIVSTLGISLKPFTTEMNKAGLTYAIPISISSVEDNKVTIFEQESSYMIVVSAIPYADVPVMSRENGMQMYLKDNKITLTDYTVEFLVKVDGLGLNRNNQILFNGRTADGKNEIFMRFAADGAAGKYDKFQLKNQGLNFDAKTSFKNNVWYHIACVNNAKTRKTSIYVNGVLDTSFDNPGEPTMIESNTEPGIRFCGENDNDYYMRSNMQGSEIRLWTVARSASEIQNNMYGIDPKTPGLAAYWKSSENEGADIIDRTGNGNNAKLFGTPKWNSNQRVQVGLGLD